MAQGKRKDVPPTVVCPKCAGVGTIEHPVLRTRRYMREYARKRRAEARAAAVEMRAQDVTNTPGEEWGKA